MKILVIGDSEENHISKYHEAFRRGLVRLYNASLYGKGYCGFDPALKTYKQILAHVYPDGARPDLLLASYTLASSLEKMTFEYEGLEDVECPKAIILSDWWKITDHFKDDYPAWIEKYNITYVLCQHQAPLRIYAETAIADRLIHFPAAVDPELLNDFQLPKKYDVGFLGCGISPFDPFYPEREAIHKMLLTRPDLNYFWKPHPGYNPLPQDHPLVGKNFGMLINQCRMFAVTGSRLQNTFGKYFEVPACASLMLATHADGADAMGLIDGVNYVKVTPENILGKIDYYLAHPHEAARITEAGYRLAMTQHSIYARATQFYDLARKAARPSLDVAGMGPLKLHLGCGLDRRDGYINIDHSSASHADLVSSYMDLTGHFTPGTVQEILSMHAINYVPLWEARDLFKTCLNLLIPGGKLIIETVNIESAAKKMLDHVGDFEEYLEGLRGLNGFGLDHVKRKEKYSPNMLGWGAWHLTKELQDAGFAQVRTLPATSHCLWRDMRVEATK